MKSKIKLEDRLGIAITFFTIVMILGEATGEGSISFFGGILAAYWGYRFVLDNLSFSIFCSKKNRKRRKNND